MKLGILGTGDIATTLGGAWNKIPDVTLGSRANPSVIGPSSVFLSGDDAEAKRETEGLLRDLGWSDGEIVDLGGIETARGPEHYLVLFAKLAAVLKTEAFNIRVIR
jgi:hypothetical protein